MQPAHSGTNKSGPLSYTQNYVFNKADILGKGATATVYLGRHRIHGHVVAIKEFDNRQIRQIITAKKREIDLLRNIKHKNVMTLIACEPEGISGEDVMVMEYCQGGSVFNLLENPQHMHGFPEHEFLKFIKDICSGLKHLRSRHVIHRDIKPGNIMKKVDEDGSTLYVLTDFGAARELPEDETFMSIYGTEEYIHPDMYQRAVLRQSGQSEFGVNVDLWSLGVTVYHCACGHLPFRAYGGRQDARTMFQITSGRQSGVISGVQKTQNGPIEWSKTLPEICHLSRSLRRLLEPILAGIFEPDTSRQITYDKLFKSVEDIVAMETLNVFIAQTGTQTRIFIHKHLRFVHLQECIANLTDIPSSRQVILVADKLLTSIIDVHQQIQEYPTTVLNSQLFVYDREDADYVRLQTPRIPDFPSLTFGSTLSTDATTAKKCLAIGYFIETKLKEVLENQALIREAVFNIWHYIKDVLHPIQTCVPIIEKLLKEASSRLETLQLSQTNLQAFSSMLSAIETSDVKHEKMSSDWFLPEEASVKDVIERAKVRVGEIQVYLTVLLEKMREQDLVYSVAFRGCEEEEQCLSKFQQLLQNINSVYTTFVKHKKYGELHEHEIFIHKVEGRRLEEHCVKLISLYQGHCLQNMTKMHKAAFDYSSKLMKHLIRSDKVEANVKCVMDCQAQVNDKLNKVDDCYRAVSQSVSAKIKDILLKQSNGLELAKVQKTESHVDVKSKHTEEAGHTEEQSHLGGANVSSGSESVKEKLLRQLMTEVHNLQNESSELDATLQSNFDSVVELRSLLQESNLSTSSLVQEESSAAEGT